MNTNARKQAKDKGMPIESPENFELPSEIDFRGSIRGRFYRNDKVWTLKVTKGKINILAAIRKELDLQDGDEIEIIKKGKLIILLSQKDRPRAYRKIHKLATEMLEDEIAATLWLNEPQFGLSGAIPVEHMRTRNGAKEVEDLIGQILHGIVA